RKLYTNIPGDDYMTAGWNTLFWDFTKPVPESVRKISAECGDRAAVMAVMRDYPELRLYPNRGEDWYQITHVSVSKYSGIAYLTGITGIDTKDVIAFGDDFNDIEMLENCGAGVAMENADTAVKQAARFVCGSNEDDGLARFLDEHILGENYGE
ncbi:MAG: HAD hydrolase family protein, partial [Clostridiales bacterium]|nr:HAD hydrolase family protein [Clostridiales bacterium]